MRTKELRKILLDHHARCSRKPRSSFTIELMAGLAVGIIGFKDADGERGIVFDKSVVRLKGNSVLRDDGLSIKGFPSGLAGLVVVVLPKVSTWNEFRDIVDGHIVRKDGSRIEWLESEVALA